MILGIVRYTHKFSCCQLMDQLPFLSGLYGQTQVEHSAMSQTGGDQGISDHEQGLLIKKRTQLEYT